MSISERIGPHNQTPIAGMANFRILRTLGVSIAVIWSFPVLNDSEISASILAGEKGSSSTFDSIDVEGDCCSCLVVIVAMVGTASGGGTSTSSLLAVTKFVAFKASTANSSR